jgi:hypothetical protein
MTLQNKLGKKVCQMLKSSSKNFSFIEIYT